MPSRERRERAKRVREERQSFEAAISGCSASAAPPRRPQVEIIAANVELGEGAGRYSLRGVKFAPDGSVIPLPNWGKNDTWAKNQAAAEQKALALRSLAGRHWGHTKMIRWLQTQAEKAGMEIPCQRTVRRYFKDYP
jgi:hypothetical protein